MDEIALYSLHLFHSWGRWVAVYPALSLTVVFKYFLSYL